MLVDVRVIFSGPMALIVAFTLTAVALLGKWIAAFLTEKVFHYSPNQGRLIFGLSSAHAAATLAIILVGYKEGILDENILNGTIILILITCIVASVNTQKAATKIVLEFNEDITSTEPDTAIENILIPLSDFTKMEMMLDLAVLIKNKKSIAPIHLLSVVPNNIDADMNLKQAKKKLGETVKYASSTDTKIELIATLDHNVSSGIVRTAKEKEVGLILCGWPKKPGFIDRIMGDLTDSLIDDTSAMLMMAKLTRPLNIHHQLILICPPLAENEEGFVFWLAKIFELAKELSIQMEVFGNDKTNRVIQNIATESKATVQINFTEFNDWNNYEAIRYYVKAQDLIVVAGARKGTLSYRNSFELNQKMLERYFPEESIILVFPTTVVNLD